MSAMQNVGAPELSPADAELLPSLTKEYASARGVQNRRTLDTAAHRVGTAQGDFDLYQKVSVSKVRRGIA